MAKYKQMEQDLQNQNSTEHEKNEEALTEFLPWIQVPTDLRRGRLHVITVRSRHPQDVPLDSKDAKR